MHFGNGDKLNEVIKMGGIWYEKYVPAHLYSATARTAARHVGTRPRHDESVRVAMNSGSTSEFPRSLHHLDEVLVVVDGRADAAVIVQELRLRHLPRQTHQ